MLELLQRFNHSKYFSNDVMANGLAIHQSDPVSTMNDSFSSYLASAPPAEQKNLLGNRLYPLVERHQVIYFLESISYVFSQYIFFIHNKGIGFWYVTNVPLVHCSLNLQAKSLGCCWSLITLRWSHCFARQRCCQSRSTSVSSCYKQPSLRQRTMRHYTQGS